MKRPDGVLVRAEHRRSRACSVEPTETFTQIVRRTMPPPPFLVDELVEEVLLRLPPDEPAWLVRASAACKSWRHILAAARFRLRYRELHGTPPVLGLYEHGCLVPTSALFPAQLPRNRWSTLLDCRHGRSLFVITRFSSEVLRSFELDLDPVFNTEVEVPVPPFDIFAVDPVTGRQRRVPSPYDRVECFSAAVLCAAQGCDHHGCQDGHFLVAFVSTDGSRRVTWGWIYSSETRGWSQLTPVQHHPNVKRASHIAAPSVLVGDALYFNVPDGIIKCQLSTLQLSVFEKPTDEHGTLMAAEDGGLGFAAAVDPTNLTLWSREENGPEGAMGWTTIRVIDLKKLLSDPFSTLVHEHGIQNQRSRALVSGFAEGTQIIFLSTCVGSYVVDLTSGRARRRTASQGELGGEQYCPT